LGPDEVFCASRGKPTHETAAVSTPEADVDVPPPPGESRGFSSPVKVTRFDKTVGLILAVVVGVPLLLAVMWVVLQFVLGFLSGLLGA